MGIEDSKAYILEDGWGIRDAFQVSLLNVEGCSAVISQKHPIVHIYWLEVESRVYI